MRRRSCGHLWLKVCASVFILAMWMCLQGLTAEGVCSFRRPIGVLCGHHDGESRDPEPEASGLAWGSLIRSLAQPQHFRILFSCRYQYSFSTL